MFESLPQHFKAHGLAADVRILLLMRKALERGLIRTMGDMYLVLRGIVAKSPEDYGPFTTAFYDYFLGVQIKPRETIEAAVSRSDGFKKWKENLEETDKEDPSIKDLIHKYLDEVHLTTFDIKNVIDGSEILKNDDPNMQDTRAQENVNEQNRLTEGADYSNVSTEELLERMRQVMEQQKFQHRGGQHWVGTGGRSAYGNKGFAKNGIRAGGGGGGKMARKVIGDKRFYPVDSDATLTDDNIDAALAALKHIEEETAEKYLDVPDTIKEGLKQGGIFLPYEKEKVSSKIQVALFIDNGGMSMYPYVKIVKKLFSKMEKRFAHDLKTYYFHNTMYDGAYEDVRRTKFISMERIKKLHKNYSIFIIGDADMAPYELDSSSISTWKALKERFTRVVWLNPMKQNYWTVSDTVPMFRSIFEMHPLTPKGIEKSVQFMNKKRKFWKG